MKQRYKLKSSAMSAIEYDTEKKTLKVEMTDGSDLTYLDVPVSVVGSFVSASSHGAFFNADIRNKYEYA